MGVPPTDLEGVMHHARSRSHHVIGPLPTETEQALINALAAHTAGEAEALRAWGELAADAPEPHVRYIAQIVLEDEHDHHELLTAMLERARSDAQWRTTEPGIPWVRTPSDRTALLRATDNLMRAERSDLRKLRSLRRHLRPQRNTSLLWALAEMLESDTRKHLRLLRFLRRTAKA